MSPLALGQYHPLFHFVSVVNFEKRKPFYEQKIGDRDQFNFYKCFIQNLFYQTSQKTYPSNLGIFIRCSVVDNFGFEHDFIYFYN